MGNYTWKERMNRFAEKVSRRHRRRRNLLARNLSNPLFRQRIIADKKKALKSDRKHEHMEVREVLRQIEE